MQFLNNKRPPTANPERRLAAGLKSFNPPRHPLPRTALKHLCKLLSINSVKPSQTQSNHAFGWGGDSLSPQPSKLPLAAPARQIRAEQRRRNPQRAPAQTDALVNRKSYIVNMQSNPVKPIARQIMPCLITRNLCPINQGNPRRPNLNEDSLHPTLLCVIRPVILK